MSPPREVGKIASSSTKEGVSSRPVQTVENTGASCQVAVAVNMGPTTATKPKTPLRADVFRKYLDEHPDRVSVERLLNMIESGADVGYVGPRLGFTVPNAKSADTYSEQLSQSIAKEISRGHTVGPFLSPPLPKFVTNSLGVRPKPNGDYRIIMDLSRPAHQSVNDHIDKEAYSVKYSTIDHAIKLISRTGRPCWLAKVDIKHAFRLVPVRAVDHHLLGYKHNNLYYYDVVLPFGSRSSPKLFRMVSEAVHWIFSHFIGDEKLVHYMDDFLIVARSKRECAALLKRFDDLCDELGVPRAPEKTMGPAVSLPFLGIVLNTADATLGLPDGELFEISEKIDHFITKDQCTKRELQSLIGSLSFATKCIPAGRLFTRRLINALPRRLSDTISFDDDCRDDLLWWKEFLPKWNGTAPFLSVNWLSPLSSHLYTDASRTAFAVYFGGKWFAAEWPHCVDDDYPINLLEFIPVLAACHLWAREFAGRRILFHCDNLGVVQAWHKQGSGNRAILHVMLLPSPPRITSRCPSLMSRVSIILWLILYLDYRQTDFGNCVPTPACPLVLCRTS